MAFQKHLMGLAVVASMWANTVSACTSFPPQPPLPGESDAAFQQRNDASLDARKDEERRSFQATLFDRASSVQLGIVRSSRGVQVDGIGGLQGRAVSVDSIATLKGEIVSREVTLADARITTCGVVGGGSATQSYPGAYVILFMDVAFGNDAPQPFGLRIEEAREPRILQAVTDAAVRLRESGALNKGTR